MVLLVTIQLYFSLEFFTRNVVPLGVDVIARVMSSTFLFIC